MSIILVPLDRIGKMPLGDAARMNAAPAQEANITTTNVPRSYLSSTGIANVQKTPSNMNFDRLTLKSRDFQLETVGR